jgi:hypothetical protein
MPVKFDGVIADRFDTLQLRVWNRDKPALGAMALAQGARAETAQIFLGIFAGVAILPGNTHHLAAFHMINLGGVM